MAKAILVVEDDPKQLRLIRDLLKISGYKTIEATDGEKGVELAKRSKPALILMDIMMPKMDGYNATYIIKKDKEIKEIPVVMLTGLGFELNRKLAEMMGADGYIAKPFSPGQIRELVRQFLGTAICDNSSFSS